MRKILITGSEGLIGNKVRRDLLSSGYDIIGIDLKESTLGDKGLQGDIRDKELLNNLAKECHGIIHLAAVSRVIDGQNNPELCKDVNIGGTLNVINSSQSSSNKPWIIYASSREVYGEPISLPVDEKHPLRPVNIYGRTKLTSEENINKFIEEGGQGVILRFSNVYGDVIYDHDNRVIPAFAFAAALGSELRIDGKENSFDFTHLDDTCDGVIRVIDKLEGSKESLPPIHFVSGEETSLIQLAELAISKGDSKASIVEAPPRDYDVSNFYGSYQRAKDLLEWEPKIFLEEGITRLISDFIANNKRIK